MKAENFNLLPKKMLIEIICSDQFTQAKAERRVNLLVFKKINEILDAQEKADKTGNYLEYDRLEKEYKKWEAIQKKL